MIQELASLSWIPKPRFGLSHPVRMGMPVFVDIAGHLLCVRCKGHLQFLLGPSSCLPRSLGIFIRWLTDWIFCFKSIILFLYPCAVYAGSLEPITRRRLTNCCNTTLRGFALERRSSSSYPSKEEMLFLPRLHQRIHLICIS